MYSNTVAVLAQSPSTQLDAACLPPRLFCAIARAPLHKFAWCARDDRRRARRSEARDSTKSGLPGSSAAYRLSVSRYFLVTVMDYSADLSRGCAPSRSRVKLKLRNRRLCAGAGFHRCRLTPRVISWIFLIELAAKYLQIKMLGPDKGGKNSLLLFFRVYETINWTD